MYNYKNKVLKFDQTVAMRSCPHTTLTREGVVGFLGIQQSGLGSEDRRLENEREGMGDTIMSRIDSSDYVI